jgi:hypothetical protein
MSTTPRAPVSSGTPDPAASMDYGHKQDMRQALTEAQNGHVEGASPGALGRAGLNTLASHGYEVTETDSQVSISRDGQVIGSTARYPDNSAAGWATTMHTLGNHALSDMNQNRGMNVTGDSMYRTMMEGAFSGTLDPHTRFEPEGYKPSVPANAA